MLHIPTFVAEVVADVAVLLLYSLVQRLLDTAINLTHALRRAAPFEMGLTAFLCTCALLLTPFGNYRSAGIRFAAGQGLNVGADNLGAGVAATALEFEQFESALELASTGGHI